jgi:hypothetical protein
MESKHIEKENAEMLFEDYIIISCLIIEIFSRQILRNSEIESISDCSRQTISFASQQIFSDENFHHFYFSEVASARSCSASQNFLNYHKNTSSIFKTIVSSKKNLFLHRQIYHQFLLNSRINSPILTFSPT